MIKRRLLQKASIFALLTGLVSAACGGSADDFTDGGSKAPGPKGSGGKNSGDSGDKGGSDGKGGDDGEGGKGGKGSSGGDGKTSDGRQLIPVTPIVGGGSTAGPLKPGCGPETASECAPPGGGCNDSGFLKGGDVQVIDAGVECFYGETRKTTPSATVEYITEVNQGTEYVHVRVTFDPDFVDTVYGECSEETGWTPKGPKDPKMDDKMNKPDKAPKYGHTFKDLVGSDHVELKLFNCDDDLSLHMKVDFISEDDSVACGYGSLGVTGGEGKMYVGSADDIIAASSSMHRNLNGCGYCEIENSPCPEDPATYSDSPDAPEWDFRMVYELWIRSEAFGGSGLCKTDIDYVHASPAKGETDTILVEPDDCPPPPGDDCPIADYELYLSSEGEYICVGPPNDDGDCPDGYTFDLTSEGELCVPE
jgi:hypothetical protein